MIKTKHLILGGGPSGLAFSNRLLELEHDDFIVVEKEKEVGGLCRSVDVDGAPLDMGGGHFLDVRRPRVNEFLFKFMPENEWNLFERDSQISIDNIMIGHPFEANIWQMPQKMQVEYLKSIAIAGCNLNQPQPEKFTKWIKWKLGDMVAEKYMLPYNSKIFGKDLDELGTYWLDKLPNVSFDETLLSCLNRKPYGTEPGHAQFYYPKKYGYGELWNRMAGNLQDHIIYEDAVRSIDFEEHTIVLSSGETISAEVIIVTVPWTEIECIGMPTKLVQGIKKLKHAPVTIRYFGKNMDTNAQWIYYPEYNLSYHRILVRSNFALGSSGYWTETNSNRDVLDSDTGYKNEYAYPLNTIDKPQIMNQLLKWASAKQVYGLGRWGEWQHYNSDVTVEKAINLADKIAAKSSML
jgi:protoporphyrinogen oxidase